MTNSFLAGAAAVALSFGAIGVAQAGLLQITGGSDYVTPGNNNFSSPWAGLVNASSAITVSTTAANVKLTYDFIFKEAGYNNSFTTPFGGFSNAVATDNTVGLWASVFGVQAAAGALSFSFTTPAAPGAPLANGEAGKLVGGGPDNYSFFATTNAPGVAADIDSGATGDVVWLAFDDSGASNDDNHDDLIVRITATAVPEPGTLALFGAGLLGLGFARRARRRMF